MCTALVRGASISRDAGSSVALTDSKCENVAAESRFGALLAASVWSAVGDCFKHHLSSSGSVQRAGSIGIANAVVALSRQGTAIATSAISTVNSMPNLVVRIARSTQALSAGAIATATSVLIIGSGPVSIPPQKQGN